MAQLSLVTGAAGGIGLAIAQRLAGDGRTLLLSDIDAAALERACASLPGSGHRAVVCDVANEDAVAALFAAGEADDDGIVHAIAAAGVLLFGPDGGRPPLTEITLAEWETTHRVNATGTFLTLRAFLRARRARPLHGGRFVALSSVAAQLGGYRSSAAYIASKSSVLGLVKAAAREAAGDGITVNAVAPGLIDAPMLRQSLPPEMDATAAAAIPLGRIGTAMDVAGSVAFLLGPDAAYMTGAVLDVNGGYRMQ